MSAATYPQAGTPQRTLVLEAKRARVRPRGATGSDSADAPGRPLAKL